MTTGLLLWKEKVPGLRQKSVTLGEKRIFHVRLPCAEVLREERTSELTLRRRMLTAVKRLQKAGVTHLVLPTDLPEGIHPDRLRLQPVSTVPLRELIAADWLRLELEKSGQTGSGRPVAVAAPRLTGEVVRTVTELVLRHRYVFLDVPYGMEEFARRLRREYGVSLLDGSAPEQLEKAEALVLFGELRQMETTQSVVLRLADEQVPLPAMLLPQVLEAQLPKGADRGQLLTVLIQAGVLRPGQLTLSASAT